MFRLSSSLLVLLMLPVFALGTLTLAPSNAFAGDTFYTLSAVPKRLRARSSAWT